MAKSLRNLMRDYEKHVVVSTWERNARDKKKTAKALQITVRALEKILERHGVTTRRFTRVLDIGVT